MAGNSSNFLRLDTTEDLDGYLSLHDILATERRVQCKFELPCLRLGFLNTTSHLPDLKPGTKLDLPFWMAQALTNRRRPIVSVDLPKAYKESYRDVMAADASIVNLHKLGPHFYDFGVHLQDLYHQEVANIGSMLTQAFIDRFRVIFETSLLAGTVDERSSAVQQKLDALEKALLGIGQESRRDRDRWLREQTHIIETASMVQTYRKRKRQVSDSQDVPAS